MQWLPPAAAVRERCGLGSSRDRSLTRPPGPTARQVQSILSGLLPTATGSRALTGDQAAREVPGAAKGGGGIAENQPRSGARYPRSLATASFPPYILREGVRLGRPPISSAMTTPFPDPQATTLRPKSAEAALEESERQYREMVNRAPIGIYRSTRDGRLLTANPAMARMLGYQSVEDLLRVRLADVYRDPHQRDEIVAAFARAGTSADLELEWKRTDGRTIWVQVNAHAVLNTDDGSICFESFVRDITERKLVEQELRQSEERLRLVARATNDAVWDWDLMKNVLWLGDGFRTLFRLERGEF